MNKIQPYKGMHPKRTRFNRSFQKFLITVVGNTISIWFVYFVILVLGDLLSLNMPHYSIFIYNGNLLVIALSFFISIFSINFGLKVYNRYNVISFISLLIALVFYIRFIGQSSFDNNEFRWNLETTMLTLPFAVSTILLLFAYTKRKDVFFKTSWLCKANNKAKYYSIFISFPMTAIHKTQIENNIYGLVDKLKCALNDVGYNDIFDAREMDGIGQKDQSPEIAAIEDFAAIENSSNFLLLYTHKVPSSILVELGYAIRDGINIVICKHAKAELPFLVKKIDGVNENVRVVEYNTTEQLVNIISTNHHKYFI